MPAIRPVPDAPPRAIGYIRVSTARDDMVSPEIQMVAIRDHCARMGYVLVETIEDLDLSGRFWKRRQVERAIAMIEDGQADVLVAWKWSRVSRNRLDWAIAVDRVESAGGQLDSATEPVDTSTSSGRLQRGILAEFASFESDRIGDVWREVHSRRTNQGRPANGKPRWGYEVVDGEHRPDPETGAVLAALYRRYIGGESVYRQVEWLNRQGYRTAPGYSTGGPGPWTQVTLRRMLDSGFGAGLIKVRGELRQGAHEPVIDADTWAAYQAARASRRTLRRADRSTYLLSGLMRCMFVLEDGTACDSPMGGGQYGSQRQPKYRCLAVANERRHAGGYVMMGVAEEAVLAELRAIAEKTDERSASKRGGSRRPRVQREADTLAREIAELERQLANLTGLLLREVVPESAYKTTRDEIEAEMAGLRERHAQAALAVTADEAGPLAAALLLDWNAGALSTAEKRAVLRRLIARVEVVPGRPKSSVRVVTR